MPRFSSDALLEQIGDPMLAGHSAPSVDSPCGQKSKKHQAYERSTG